MGAKLLGPVKAPRVEAERAVKKGVMLPVTWARFRFPENDCKNSV